MKDYLPLLEQIQGLRKKRYRSLKSAFVTLGARRGEVFKYGGGENRHKPLNDPDYCWDRLSDAEKLGWAEDLWEKRRWDHPDRGGNHDAYVAMENAFAFIRDNLRRRLRKEGQP